MPRMRGLLNLRALNSVKCVLGENASASLMNVTPAALSRSSGTAVTLIGSVAGSAGSFCAVTRTVVVVRGTVCVGVCASAGAAVAAKALATRAIRNTDGITELCPERNKTNSAEAMFNAIGRGERLLRLEVQDE